jgi:putative tryptophan/tyrosine transport system substrate-binding protein
LITNVAHPESNLTGFVALNVELEEKRVELLREIIPNLSRVAVLANSSNPLVRVNLDTVHRAAKRLGVTIEVFDTRSSKDVESALAEVRADAALVAADTLLLSERRQITEMMAASRIPAIYAFKEFSDAGGLLTYGADFSVLFERAADYLNRLLHGERPGNLPVQQATTFELIINLKAASALGLTIPANVLIQANEVIE